ncbi:unnamed protein product, partial [Brassica rapa]
DKKKQELQKVNHEKLQRDLRLAHRGTLHHIPCYERLIEETGKKGKFEVELLAAGGGMSVEVFNRGVIPLAYNIIKKNKVRETSTYLDGVYLIFTCLTKT